MQTSNDTIRITGMKFTVAHGVHPAEHELLQPFEVDVEVKHDLLKASVSDEIKDTLDYTKIVKSVEEVMNGPHHNLIEKLAGLIIERLKLFVSHGEVTVRIRKPRAPLQVPFETVEIELRRTFQ